MSFIFKYTLFSLQGHICLLKGHKVCTRTRYFNDWLMVDLVFTSFSLNYRTGNVSERLNLTVKVSVSAIMVGISHGQIIQSSGFEEFARILCNGC